MFDEMLESLRQGNEPERNAARNRFSAALTKKLAVVRMPHALWPIDPKINPRTEDLLCVAIFLEDKQAFKILEGVVHLEQWERRMLSASPADPQKRIENIVRGFLSSLPRGLLREMAFKFIQSVSINISPCPHIPEEPR